MASYWRKQMKQLKIILCRVNVGETFACDSTDSMINLVHQYCEDEAFMEKRKEACHQKADEIFAVDEKENYRKLCEFVEAYTLEQEKQADSR